MAVVDVLNTEAEKVSEVELSGDIFDIPVKASVLHEVVRMQLACKRAGTASVKHRSDVKGSTKKLFRQKGTGRARRGDIKSPLLRGGGSVFGPDPKSYTYSVPKKVKRLALKMALTSKCRANELIVLDNFNLDKIRTKDFVSAINKLNIKNALIVTDEKNEMLELSSRNVPGITVMRYEGLNVYDVLKHIHLVLLQSSISGVEGRFSA